MRSLLEPAPLRGGLLSRLRLDDDMPSTNVYCYQVIVARCVKTVLTGASQYKTRLLSAHNIRFYVFFLGFSVFFVWFN